MNLLAGACPGGKTHKGDKQLAGAGGQRSIQPGPRGPRTRQKDWSGCRGMPAEVQRAMKVTRGGKKDIRHTGEVRPEERILGGLVRGTPGGSEDACNATAAGQHSVGIRKARLEQAQRAGEGLDRRTPLIAGGSEQMRWRCRPPERALSRTTEEAVVGGGPGN
ncbi:hypothetical protein NDU88_008394 [Pleurodeles waltl]|uniref:Uncharacterized protein n=1 Tax=Pleurodeles waltl TaxID=8319 RepID=A0AAV7N6A8_PLEWA|nr:hypothetical protein NDU88_008394 [Pleurodeles waltl]